MEKEKFKQATKLNEEIETLKQKVRNLNSEKAGQSMFIKSGTTFFLTEEESKALIDSINARLNGRLTKAQEEFDKI